MKSALRNAASKARAVQVVRYQNRKGIARQHLDSAHIEAALKDLIVRRDNLFPA